MSNSPRIHAYIRVSTSNKGQTTDNQRKMIEDNGFAVTEWHSEHGVSGTIKATDRPAFKAMLVALAEGDTVIVTMVDRLGRTASDILNTVEEFRRLKVKVRVMQFDGVDITSSTGKMILAVMAAMAELDRDLLVERTIAGIARTKAAGTKLGQPMVIAPETLRDICNKRDEGVPYSELSKNYNISKSTISYNVSKWKDKLDEYEVEYDVRQEQYKAAIAEGKIVRKQHLTPQQMVKMIASSKAGVDLSTLSGIYKIPRNVVAKSVRKWGEDVSEYEKEYLLKLCA